MTRAGQDKEPRAHLFSDNGGRWVKERWIYEVRAAIKRHNENTDNSPLPMNVRACSFRHARISELLQLHGIDPVTVALQCGTSVQMIEKHYHRFISSAMREKLAAVREA